MIATPAENWPVSDAEFAATMDLLGPFESSPRLAVAVSGGADSLALTLLLAGWTAARQGSLLALTVDHQLRPESGQECRQLGVWLAARGIAHRVLTWGGPKPETRIEARAREARHRLLADACRVQGIFHLVFAHHRDDQAETLLMRLARGSGPDGLAAMPAMRELSWGRLLRPLLAVPHQRLVATCRSQGQDWIEDPSNPSSCHARGRLRAVSAALSREGLDADSLVLAARRAGRVRAVLDGQVAALLAASVEAHGDGYLWLDPGPWRAADPEIRRRALARCVTTIGAPVHPLRESVVEGMCDRLLAPDPPGGATLAGCRILWRRGRWLICREPEALAPPQVIDLKTGFEPGPEPGLEPGGTRALLWDRRWWVEIPPDWSDAGLAAVVVGALGATEARQRTVVGGANGPPPVVAATLPALRDGAGVVAVPGLGYCRAGVTMPRCRFRPPRPISGPAFVVV
ncbi:MAG: tRNA lysidine(34) synthetase TilS [Azospirillaceae bacterium]|nr:tRNA lysidine(34) synthetase TilS [Azospirillaceae bacterium]